MRGTRLLLFLALLAWGRPARADITAEYYVWGPLGPSLTVAVSDHGDARIQIRGNTVAIRRDGIFYLVRGNADGMFVIREEEFARIEARKLREAGGLPEFPDLLSVRIVEHGIETVGGREGKVLLLAENGESALDSRFAFVMNSDPDLAPVGPLIAKFFGGESNEAFPVPGHLREIFARGTLIRMSFMLRLEKTSHGPISPASFELPGPVLSGEEAERRLGAAW